jgi:hypothetical protein
MHAHAHTHTHVNTSFFARRELISVTVTLAEKYYSRTILHWNESFVTFKYNEQRLFLSVNLNRIVSYVSNGTFV